MLCKCVSFSCSVLPEDHTVPLLFFWFFFQLFLIQYCLKNMKIRPSLFTQTSAVAQFISYLPPSESTWVVGCRGCCSDIALVLAVKWSICRYVCLHHRHPLTHSLLHSPDEQKRLIYSGFKDAAVSPIWFRLPGGSVFPFESQPNRLWWHLCVLHESTTFHWEKYACSVVPAMIENGKELKLGTIQVLIKEMDAFAQFCRTMWS